MFCLLRITYKSLLNNHHISAYILQQVSCTQNALCFLKTTGQSSKHTFSQGLVMPAMGSQQFPNSLAPRSIRAWCRHVRIQEIILANTDEITKRYSFELKTREQ
eukprot:XP_001692361.1 predicted protein [Chlamydomonas reinhardtii]